MDERLNRVQVHWRGLMVASLAFLAVACGELRAAQRSGPPTIHLDPSVRFQTIVGWEATAQAGQWGLPGFENYRETLIDLAINDLGINRVRMEVRSGAENPVDYFADFISGQSERPVWKKNSYIAINDNGSSRVASGKGFHWSELDHQVDVLVEPMRQRLKKARGEELYVVLTYVDFGGSSFEHFRKPAEYAEFMSQAFSHMQARNGWVPDALEVILEPDVADGWSPQALGKALVATATRLELEGFHPDFIGPSNTDMSAAVEWFDEMIAVPGVLDHLSELSYHRYRGVGHSALLKIGERAEKHGLRSGMLEHIGSGYEDLHQDLEVGRVSAWSQYTLAWEKELMDNGTTYYRLDLDDPSAPAVTPGKRTPYLRQYFRYIRRGAVRIEATGGGSGVDPLAFVHPDGRTVVVVKAERGATFTVRDLPVGTYGVEYTTRSAAGFDLPDVVVEPGKGIDVLIPSQGVATIFAR